MQRFGDTVASTAEDVNAKFILVPWTGSGSIIEDSPLNSIQHIFTEQNRRHSIHTSVKHANFIQDLFASSTCNVLILVDRGINMNIAATPNSSEPNQLFAFMSQTSGIAGTCTFQHIYFPFFGGRDDRAILEMVSGVSGVDGVRITVVRYKKT